MEDLDQKNAEIIETRDEINVYQTYHKNKPKFADTFKAWILPLMFVFSFAVLIYTTMGFVDLDPNSDSGFFKLLFLTDTQSVPNAIGSINELLAGILAIVLTVVAIVVQLAAQRYSPKLVDMFIEDKVNLSLFAFMVFCVMYSVMVTYSIKTNFYPIYSAGLLILLVLILLGLLIPYFNYVFTLLTPINIIGQIRKKIKISILTASQSDVSEHSIVRAQRETATGMEQITDTILTSVSNMDRNVALMSLHQVRNVMIDYLECKKDFEDNWFTVSPIYFINVTQESFDEIIRQRTWVESKGMMDMELIFKSAMIPMPDAVSAITFNTRLIGRKAVEVDDEPAVDMIIQYFNTFLRIAGNLSNQKVLYIILYQYRLMTVYLFDKYPEKVNDVFFYFKYYAQLAIQKGVWFIYIVAAYDVAELYCRAFDRKLGNLDTLLDSFLEWENFNAGNEKPVITKGVKKAQLTLAAYLYSKGDKTYTSRMTLHMKRFSRKEEMIQLKNEILAVKEKKFWEITERGINFEYIDDAQKEALKLFYEELFSY